MFDEFVSLFTPLLLHRDQFWGMLFMLVFGHCLADFALQSPSMAQGKNSSNNPKEIWIPIMFGHCMIHAGIVFIITDKLFLALYELGAHFIIDDLKCRGRLSDGKFTFAKDQILHILDVGIIAVLFYVLY